MDENEVLHEMQPHVMKIGLPDETNVLLTKATFLYRRIHRINRMPSQSEVIDWIIRSCPIDDMWEFHYGTKTVQTEESEGKAEVLPMPDKGGPA